MSVLNSNHLYCIVQLILSGPSFQPCMLNTFTSVTQCLCIMTGMRHDRSLNRCQVISASGNFGTCKCKQVFSTLPNICFTFWILRKFKFMRIFIFMISISAVLKILNVLYQFPNYLYVLWNDMRYDVYNIVRWEIYTWFRVLIAIRSARFLTRDEDNLFYIVVYCNTLSFEITIKLRNYSVIICSTKHEIKFENFYQLASHMYIEHVYLIWIRFAHYM